MSASCSTSPTISIHGCSESVSRSNSGIGFGLFATKIRNVLTILSSHGGPVLASSINANAEMNRFNVESKKTPHPYGIVLEPLAPGRTDMDNLGLIIKGVVRTKNVPSAYGTGGLARTNGLHVKTWL